MHRMLCIDYYASKTYTCTGFAQLLSSFQAEQKDGFLIFNQPVKTGDSMPPHCSELLNYPFAPFLSRLNLTPLTA